MTDKPTALVVEDDTVAREAMLDIVGAEGFAQAGVGSLTEARAHLKRDGEVAIVLVDLDLPDGSGLELLDEDGESHDIVVITGDTTVDTVVRSLRMGAIDYLTKPVDIDRLRRILADSLRRVGLTAQNARTLAGARESGRFHRIIGGSKPMMKVFRQIQRVAPTTASVLIQGDTGTGKEMVAQTIHELSDRGSEPFIALNCGAISGTLIESELFGHEKGSFTGATKRHLGVFERAHGGTLFLDEITEMPLDLQVKLLRVLETGSFSRVGGEATIHTDARLVAATNRDPERAIAAGQLREDLFYRLRVFPIALPPLRSRPGDVERLATRFLAEINASHRVEKSLTAEAVEWLDAQPWPGNVRELKNLMTRAWIMADEEVDVAAVSDLAVADDAVPAAVGGGDQVSIAVGSTIAEAEKKLILATLEKFGDNKSTAARVLGISVKTLYNRLNVYAAADSAS